MSLPYFFIENISTADQIILPEETSKHCIQVLRMKENEQLQLTDGKGNLFIASINNADRKHCTVKIESQKLEPQQSKKISIAISLLKNANRFEWFLEKATEIGVTEIIPLICKRTERQHFRFERMKHILIAAMLQSEQSWLPLLHEPQPFDKVVMQPNYTCKFIAHCEQEEKKNILTTGIGNEIQILIGPEGDFTNEEILLAQKNYYIPASLGNTRLRTETAGIVAATLLKGAQAL